jgi:hypothetical protein
MWWMESHQACGTIDSRVTPQSMAWLSVMYHSQVRLPLSFSRVSFFILISKWTPKYVKLEMYDL